MDLNTITVANFMSYFYRDFAYLPVWSSTQLYNSGSKVYYPTTLLFYLCDTNGTIGTVPNGTSPWPVVADSIYNYVQDQDIQKAFLQAQTLFNQSFFGDDATEEMAYLYLTAHFLIIDLRAAGAGLSGTGAFPVSGRSVGSVSESYGIPAAYLNNPAMTLYTQTQYGMKYLSLILPQSVGNVVSVYGGTQP